MDYQHLFHTASDAFWIADPQGNLKDFNAACCRLTGFHKEELPSMGVAALEVPEYAGRSLENLAKALKDGSHDGATLYRRKDGTAFPVQLRMYCIRDAAGAPEAVWAMVRDVTNRRDSPDTLPRIDDALNVFINAVPTPAFLIDRSGTLLVLNDALAKSLGHPIHELMGKDAFSFLPPAMARSRRLMVDQVIATGTGLSFEDSNRGRHFINYLAPVLDGEGCVTGIAVFALDISSRKAAESAALESEKRYHSIIDALSEGILLQDPTGSIVACNASAERILGMSREQLLGVTPMDSQWLAIHEDFSPFPGEEHPSMMSLRTGGGVDGVIMGIRKPAGALVWLSINSRAIRSSSGQVDMVVTSFSDITEFREAQLELVRLASVLGATTDVVCTMDEQGRLSYVNGAGRTLFALGDASVSALNLRDLQPEWAARLVFETGIPAAIASGAWSGDAALRGQAGHDIPVSQVILSHRDPAGNVSFLSTVIRDVSERLEAKRLAEERGALLRRLSERVPGVIYQFQMTPDGRSWFPYSSDGITGIYEVTPEEVAQDATRVFARLHPDDIEGVRDSILDSFATLKPWRLEYRVVLPKRGVRWLRGESMPEKLQDGSVLWHGYIIDVTEAHEAQQDLQRLASIIEASRDFIAYADMDGRVLYVNRAGRALLHIGATDGPLTIRDFVSSEDLTFLDDELLPRLKHNEEWLGEIRMKDFVGGPDVPVDVNAFVIHHPLTKRPIGIGNVSRDLRERKRAEEAVEAERDRLREIIDSQFGFVAVLSLDGVITMINRTLLEVGGVSEEHAKGTRFWDAYWFSQSPEARTLMRSMVTRAKSGESSRREFEARVGEGRTITVDGSIGPFRNSRGDIVGVIAFGVDISERKKLESQLLQAQKMDAIGQLAGGVAHDFNNSLTVILGYCGLILQEVREKASHRSEIGQIKKAAETASALTRQLLAFSRRQVYQPLAMQPNDVVNAIQPMLRRLIGEDIELSLSLSPSLGSIMADSTQIEQVLLNLVVNARDSMPTGGGIRIETCNADLDVHFSNAHLGVTPGPYIMLSVADNGCGMADETRTRIFEPFFTTKRSGIGTGLGLSTVYGIVKQSAGHIIVHSQVGQGTTMVLYFPRTSDQAISADTTLVPQHNGGTERILIAEDDADIRQMVSRFLTSLGYQVMEARNGREALAIAEACKDPIDLLVSDVVMPEIGGRVLAERLVTSHPETRVLFNSGYTDDAVVRHGVVEGTPFLQKPFTLDQLHLKIREILDPAN